MKIKTYVAREKKTKKPKNKGLINVLKKMVQI